jgi:hypothetical protein
LSHRDNCPTRWEAERQGARAFEYGSPSYSNPYGRYHDRGNQCRDAERAWEDGHRRARRQAEEEAAHRRQEQRRAEQREWERQEQRHWEQQAADEAQQMEDEYAAAMEAQQAEQYFWMEQDQLRETLG